MFVVSLFQSSKLPREMGSLDNRTTPVDPTQEALIKNTDRIDLDFTPADKKNCLQR